ncbi:MAG: AmmeMemoRadiSam system protein B [Candidatus Njordarchaeota archaeon]
MEVREPVVAGFFYPAEKNKLIESLKSCFMHELGPKILPSDVTPQNKYNLKSVIVPHAGYIYSGPCAAHSYMAIREDRVPDTFIMIGPNHSGLGTMISVYPRGIWRTPLGDVKIDEEVASKLIKNDMFAEDKLAHLEEHSLEVQLPFMIYTFEKEFQIVPISVMDQKLKTMREVAGVIYDIMEESEKDIMIIASSDMSHYVPYSEAYDRDWKALEKAEAMDEDGFYEVIERENVSACGYGPIAVAMMVAKYFYSKGIVLQYYTSGDITGDKSLVVGYASIVYGDFIMAPPRKQRRKEAIREVPLIA